MTITLKLYASLTAFLPAAAEGHAVRLEVAESTSPLALLERYRVPTAQVHLVLVNGVFVPPSKRAQPLRDGDELAVWPAVAGG
jgi:sulfur carrier protein ThiS